MSSLAYIISKRTSILGVFLMVWIGVTIYIYGEEDYSFLFLVAISFCFGLISSVVFILNLIVEHKLLPSSKVSESLFSMKSLLFSVWMVITIGISNYGFVLFLSDASFRWEDLFKLIWITLLIGLLPVIGVHLLESNKRLKNKVEEKKPISEHLSEINVPNRWTLKINTSDSRNFSISSLLYVESQKNNLIFHFETESVMKVRMTLKSLQEQLQEFTFLIRCHRSFLVNMNKVKEINGNAQGFTLELENEKDYIPVSRSYMKKIEDWSKNG